MAAVSAHSGSDRVLLDGPGLPVALCPCEQDHHDCDHRHDLGPARPCFDPSDERRPPWTGRVTWRGRYGEVVHDWGLFCQGSQPESLSEAGGLVVAKLDRLSRSVHEARASSIVQFAAVGLWWHSTSQGHQHTEREAMAS